MVFAQACAGHMRMDISREPFCAEIKGDNPDAPDITSITCWALKLTIRIPQCDHTLWGMPPYVDDQLVKKRAVSEQPRPEADAAAAVAAAVAAAKSSSPRNAE